MDSNLIVYAIDAGIGDCILIVDKANNKKILIDSGPAMGRGKFSVEESLSSLLANDNTIDLAVVTHNDNDHIGGFKSLLEKDVISVKQLLFNDIETVSKVYSTDVNKISFKQDKALASYLDSSSIKSELIVADDNYDKKIKIGAFNLTFLSPSETALKKLKEAGDKKLGKISDTSSSNSKTISEYLSDIKVGKDSFESDLSPTNRSSISFVLEIEDISLLFLADINAEVVVRYLKQSEECKFDLVKLSHHGSAKNTNSEMLANLHSNSFLICTDAMNSHEHPSLKTLARVINYKPDAKFYFSSSTEKLIELTKEIKEQSYYATQGVMKIEFTYKK